MKNEGVWPEPDGGTTLGVAMKLIAAARIQNDESNCVCITGNRLNILEVVRDKLPFN